MISSLDKNPPAASLVAARLAQRLELAQPLEPGAPSYVSAASGLVRVGERFYVVADDEQHLVGFAVQGGKPGEPHRLLPGTLPSDPKARKAQKPDFEALTFVPEGAHGALLAVGSGSTPARERAVLVHLDAAGKPAQNEVLSLQALYRVLARRFPELNIEGVAVHGGKLYLGQRGNGAKRDNAIIAFDLATFLASLRAAAAPPVLAIHPLDLGKREGVALSLTDLSALADGRIVFTAAAEDTESTYDDGESVGSAIGVWKDGAILAQRNIAGKAKIEGVHAEVRGQGIRAYVVNDPDDRKACATLREIDL